MVNDSQLEQDLEYVDSPVTPWTGRAVVSSRFSAAGNRERRRHLFGPRCRRSIRALRSVMSSGALPATAVTARMSSSSGEAIDKEVDRVVVSGVAIDDDGLRRHHDGPAISGQGVPRLEAVSCTHDKRFYMEQRRRPAQCDLQSHRRHTGAPGAGPGDPSATR